MIETTTTSAQPSPHPWYGPCDALRPDGGCAECAKAQPSADDVERAREIAGNYAAAFVVSEAAAAIETALTAARAQGRAEMREMAKQACEQRSQWAEGKIEADASGRDGSGWAAQYSLACDDCAEIVGALPTSPTGQGGG